MITLEQLKELLYYDPDTGNFIRIVNRAKYVEGQIAGTENNGYIIIELYGKGYSASRLAWFYMTGEWPENGFTYNC